MTPAELESFIYAQIPVTERLGVRVLRLDGERAEVQAPLSENRNHLGTVFGGSLNAVLVVACYAWLFNILKSRGLPFHVVIKSSRTQYLKPVPADFTAVCEAPDAALVEKFLRTLERRSRGQLTLTATAFAGGEAVCEFEGEFVAQ